ncbi:SH3 domain-containing protein [Anaerobranca gottschalkii]|uniref:SH3 domain-containing protein n=1 Tax=Anaerobranca gottschalkii DSM 13577 TaxID=1120990 RepID=A0A1H9ZJ08_9FIRM|nr:SH3 domain-containing protein [Anaerobranca gottschalkii]SES80821.1 SH3 domain-containing protein [Anaerobranca gottschalkii DSM 13577]
MKKRKKCLKSTVSLNVRADATTDSERVGSFSPGQEVIITGQVNNGWYRVDYLGRVAYVHGNYLSDQR